MNCMHAKVYVKRLILACGILVLVAGLYLAKYSETIVISSCILTSTYYPYRTVGLLVLLIGAITTIIGIMFALEEEFKGMHAMMRYIYR
ncbi:hypothetical protein KAS06_03845 [Candidatus Bathyarchaeota archaeon]|nr:hypothetical protein [Candidatus Bathyarchaeota archaeon]